MILGGLDLAWGEKNPDGVCLLEGHPDQVRCRFLGLVHGDDQIVQLFSGVAPTTGVLLAIDAPVVCPNPDGSRPVDRLTHKLFHAEHGGAHPSNQKRCARPLRVVERLKAENFTVGLEAPWHRRQIIETFPHPCTLRWFDRDMIFKYKKGPVGLQRQEFAALQRALRSLLRNRLPRLADQVEIIALLHQPWSKPIEDQTDALMCALVAYDHWYAQGKMTEVLGDLNTGFMVIPR
ncbi:MAG: DUF429 domain-containing protein [Verrucomicrobiota bacterium]